MNGALSDLGNLLSGRKTIPTRNISVIIPTKNRFNLLLKALKSCSWQTRLPSEVIIVNDGNVFSEKESVEIASVLGEDCPFEFLGNQHHGAAGARKTGAQFATSEILTYLDDDNLMWPTWLESVDREFKLDSDQLIYGAQLRKEWGNSILAETVYSHQKICQGNFIDSGCVASSAESRRSKLPDGLTPHLVSSEIQVPVRQRLFPSRDRDACGKIQKTKFYLSETSFCNNCPNINAKFCMNKHPWIMCFVVAMIRSAHSFSISTYPVNYNWSRK